MVRLSLANMYLHGFAAPHIFEYDTLTSEDRWNEYADVILANPPFMSPKGGIRPHNRFSVKAKRSEVLFVDYMAEHLTPTGRAGIIVPEGIIFQSQTAYKQLRKMLVENYLVAVVSLPAGVFNPYSGVKTSILILDRALARKTDRIAFLRVESDGFDLGAQRRPVGANNLPQAQAELAAFLSRLRAGETGGSFRPMSGIIVEKEKVAADGDYNLSGERFRVNVASISEWPMAKLGEVFASIRNGINVTQKEARGRYKVTRIQTIADGTVDLSKTKWTDDDVPGDRFMQTGDILLSHINSESHLAKTAIFPECADAVVHGINLLRLRPRADTIKPLFALYMMKSDYFVDRARSLAQRAVNQASINVASLSRIAIPLPPLEVQREIVAEIEGYQKVIDGARAVVENYRPHIVVDPEWPCVPVKSVAAVESGFGFPLPFQGNTEGDIPFLKVSDMNLPGNEIRVVSWNNAVSKEGLRELKAKSFPEGTVIFPKIGAAIATNKKRILTRESTYDNNVMGIVPITKELLPSFLYCWLVGFDLSLWASDGQPPSMRKTVVEQHEIPLPPLAVQQSILEGIEAEQTIVEANRELIQRLDGKIQAAIARVWEERLDQG